MLIDLSELLSLEGKVKNVEIPIEMDVYKTQANDYKIVSKKPIGCRLTSLGDKKILIDADIEVEIDMPCDRCLDDVKNKIIINTSKEVDLGETDFERRDALDELNYISGTVFDAEKFAYGEILVNLPMKVLCSENCKGICNRCGTNLNHTNCGCDTTELDPRMAKALEVFNRFKEV